MKSKLSLIILAFFIFFVLPSAWAQQRITSAPCPHSCRSVGLPKSHCRDWKEGNTCYVENLRVPLASTGPAGRVSSQPCPHSCRTQGIPRSACRDWRQGDTCFVEDLRTAAAPVQQPPAAVQQAPTPMQQPPAPIGGGISSSGAVSVGTTIDSAQMEYCRQTRRHQIAPPYVDISRVKSSGNVFKPTYRVYGSLEGVCLREAGYFEEGRLKQSIAVPISRDFNRQEFNLQIRMDRSPEIRVYNIHGDRAVAPISPNDVTD